MKGLDSIIKKLETMKADNDTEEGWLCDVVDRLTELSVGHQPPKNEPLSSLKVGQFFVDEDDVLKMVVEDHRQMDVVAFVVVKGENVGEDGYEEDEVDVKVVEPSIDW